jgi:hypothetical protein
VLSVAAPKLERRDSGADSPSGRQVARATAATIAAAKGQAEERAGLLTVADGVAQHDGDERVAS